MERDWNAILDLPATCTGVGAALRDYYLVRDQHLPDRLAELLKELDEHQRHDVLLTAADVPRIRPR
jgi:hypothetical protein